MYLGVTLCRPTAYSKVTFQHNHLNLKNIIQNQKYNCRNNKFIYLTFIHCTCKFEKHKQSFLCENYEQNFPNKKHTHSFLIENYEQNFPNKKHTQSFLIENYEQIFPTKKHKQSFPSENYNRTYRN